MYQSIAQNLNKIDSSYTAYFSNLDLQYAYNQLNLLPETARHCNFNVINGDLTGKTDLKLCYGFTDMPAELQSD